MKRFSAKYLNNYETLSKATIGIEFECFFDITYYKVIELLNRELHPVKLHGFRTYHSDFKVNSKNFKLERDLSGGENMAEIITGPLDYHTAKIYLIKILSFIDKYGYTTDKSSIHLNISFPNEFDLSEMSVLKSILEIDEELIYKKFPSRKHNIYAKSVKSIIPFKDYDYSNISIQTVSNNIYIPDDKYYGINFTHINKKDAARVEYRYIGGKDYQKQVGDIIELMDSFVLNTYVSLTDKTYSTDNIEELNEIIEQKQHLFKNLSSYENFMIEYPNINIMVDGQNIFEIISSMYGRLYEKLFDFLSACDDEYLGECTINFYIETGRLEIVNAGIKSNDELLYMDFIDCNIDSGIFVSCNIIDSTVRNTELYKCKVDTSEVRDSKVINSNIDLGTLNNCFFQAGYLNSNMVGGVFRSGKLGPEALIDETTTIVGKDEEGFFKTKSKDDEDDEKKYPNAKTL